MLGNRSAGELLAQQAGQEKQRAAWPVIRHDVLGLATGISRHEDDTLDRFAADVCGVVLKDAGVAVRADEVELLLVIERADTDKDGPDGLGAVRDAVHRGALYGDVVGQVVQPCRVVVREALSGLASSVVRHAMPPSKRGRATDAA